MNVAATTEGDLYRALELFLAQRPRLLGVARRVTRGDAAHAEDVVQEVWLRWQRTDRSVVRNPEAFLTATTTRLAINVVQAACHRHETPSETLTAADPVTEDPAAGVGREADARDAWGVLLARLPGTELAALVLRDAFAYPYADVARVLRTSVVNARQLVRRGRAHLADDRRRATVRPQAQRALTSAFLVAARTGELRPLEGLLAQV
jgi:RNA polymerase sigma-70 factor (ECF subfamily)